MSLDHLKKHTNPERIPQEKTFSQFLIELSHQNEEKIRAAANQIPFNILHHLTNQFQYVIENQKIKVTKQLAQQILNAGFCIEDIKNLSQK